MRLRAPQGLFGGGEIAGPCAPAGYGLSFSPEDYMTYKLDGAKFPSLEELIQALYPIYADRMSEDEFRKYAEEHAEKQE
jgi:hypothetical protein